MKCSEIKVGEDYAWKQRYTGATKVTVVAVLPKGGKLPLGFRWKSGGSYSYTNYFPHEKPCLCVTYQGYQHFGEQKWSTENAVLLPQQLLDPWKTWEAKQAKMDLHDKEARKLAAEYTEKEKLRWKAIQPILASYDIAVRSLVDYGGTRVDVYLTSLEKIVSDLRINKQGDNQ